MNAILPKVSRRTFLLQSMALAGGGFAVGFGPPTPAHAGAGELPGAFTPNPWLRIASSGAVTVVVDKAEMGQGVLTSFPMIVADELDADWSLVRYEVAPADKKYAHPWFGVQGTGGSTTVRAMWAPLRKASAAAREMLVAAAAAEWKVDPATLRTENSFVIAPDGRKRAYGDLAGKAAKMPVPAEPTLKSPQQFRLIGTSVKRLDTPPKTNGTAKFGIDAKLPGLLTAVVARAPVPGAKPVKYDAAKIRAMPGVKAVLPVQSPTAEGIAVLATNYWYAKQARDALDIEWDLGAGATLSTDTMRTEMTEAARKGEGLVAQQTGDVGAVSGKSVKALYDVPYLVHAPMEPMNCTAWVKPDGVEIWSGSQAQGPNQMTAAALTGFTPEQVKIHSLLLGGGFGRRFAPDMLTEAVLLSKSAGAPVKVVYSREDDTRGYYYRPMAVCEMTGTLDGKGRPLGFKASTVCDSLATGSGFEAMIMKDRIDGTAVEGLVEPPYAIPNVRVDWTLYQPGVRTWFWRSVGSTQNAFFLESFVDELAHAAGQDPVAYRRSLMAGHPRHLAVLELAAQKSGWGQPLPKGVARGVAVAESFGSYVAEVAEVTLVDGKPKVLRVVIAADIGTVVNPDTVVAQMEGAMIYGLSAALQGEITFDAGKVQQSNFHDYPVVRMNEAPKVEVHLIRSTEAPGGVGEPGTPPIAPAVANALFALTGERVRSLPLSRHNFKTA